MVDNPSVPPTVEAIPSQAGSVSAIGSANAPFIYFENAPAFGHVNGIVRVTLEAARDMPVGNTVAFDRVIVGHLRMNVQAARSLIAALQGALLLAEKGPSEAKN